MLEYVSEAGRQRRHKEEATAMSLVVPALLHVIKIARMMVVNGIVFISVTNRMVVMRQAVHGVLGRRECDGYGWHHKGKDSKGGDPDRHSE
jgi:hypothetical protein